MLTRLIHRWRRTTKAQKWFAPAAYLLIYPRALVAVTAGEPDWERLKAELDYYGFTGPNVFVRWYAQNGLDYYVYIEDNPRRWVRDRIAAQVGANV